MKQSLLKLTVATLFLFASQTLLADKPSWAGKGKPTAEQKEAHKKAMNAKGDDSDDKEKKSKNKKEKKQKSKEKKSKEKNSKDMKTKSIDDMKEIDKGSEKGMEQKEEKRKKWWDIFN
ncbi:hypothetical protein KY321_05415 [Candidatus Woesearchaeota archaeon]|nr:hypothetical protein [Candidatus Woesearchaeota archaeon]